MLLIIYTSYTNYIKDYENFQSNISKHTLKLNLENYFIHSY